MELPHLGEHCQEDSCNTLDFLPFKCDACQKTFCINHYNYNNHKCTSLSLKNKDFQVPICPLCNQAVPYKRTELPDIMMSAHMDRDCMSDPAEDRRRKIFNNACKKKGCKKKELIPFMCNKCKRNYCIRHRNEIDHYCNQIHKQTGENKEVNQRRLFNIFQRQTQPTSSARSSVSDQRAAPSQRPRQQPNAMSDQDALDYALKLSLQENSGSNTRPTSQTQANNNSNGNASRLNAQETEEEILARVIAESEREYQRQQNANQQKESSCSIG